MSKNLPEPGSRWRRVADGALVEVVESCGGPYGYVALRRVRELATNRRWNVRLANFHTKYGVAKPTNPEGITR